jgi:hypothetical protein
MAAAKARAGRPPVSLIVLTYNGKDDTLAFLESLACTDYPNYELILVDNASSDGTVEEARRRFPDVRIVENAENLGFAGGMNAGIARARGDYVVTLDNDRIVKDAGWLTRLVDTADSDKRIGVVVPMLLFYGTNRVQSVGQISPDTFTRVTSCTRLSGAGQEDDGQFDAPSDIAAGNGLFRRSALDRVGLFDEKMFCYFEETDLCFRLARAGYRIVSEPRSKMWHKGSATNKAESYFTIYNSYKNKLRFIIRNYSYPEKAVALILNAGYYGALTLIYAFNLKFSLSRAVLEAVFWNLKNIGDYI